MQNGEPVVLIVDDEPAIRKMCKSVLEVNGFRCILAEDGQDGLSVYRERSSEIALVLADVSMPLMNGIDMVNKMVELNPRSNVILMTGFSPQEIVPADLNKLCAVVRKPFTPKQLVSTVKKCLEPQEAQLVAQS
jgi:DNA-binding NtrC family response regulator